MWVEEKDVSSILKKMLFHLLCDLFRILIDAGWEKGSKLYLEENAISLALEHIDIYTMSDINLS